MTASATSAPPRKKRRIRKWLKWGFLGVLLAAVGFFAYIWFYPMSERNIWDFVPEDAIFVLEADDPIENWKDFSDTKVWKLLKTNELFVDIEDDANYLDTLIHDNEKIFDLLSEKKLLIVAKMYKKNDYDFLYLMDLQKGAKVSYFMDAFEKIMQTAGFAMSSTTFGKHQAYIIGEDEDALYLSFVDNVLIVSYSKILVMDALQQYEKPFYSRNGRFNTLREAAYDLENDNSLGKLHLNFDQLDEFMSVYMDEVTGTITNLAETMEFSSFDLKMVDQFVEMVGMASIDNSKPSLMQVMQKVQGAPIRAHQVLPSTTSFLLTLDFHDFGYFYEQIGLLMAEDPGYQEFEKDKKTIGKLLGVYKNEKKITRAARRGKDVDYFDWVGQEIALAMIPSNESGSKQSYVGLFHTPDRENAVHDLEKIGTKIKNRTPVRFRSYSYAGRDINYLKLKGFFELFMGKLFEKFDQPKYVVLDDFVVFSNDTSAIHRIIDVVDGKHPSLPMQPGFREFFGKFQTTSSYFLYANTQHLYPFLPSLVSGESAQTVRKNKAHITAFPQAGLQLLNEDGLFAAKMYMEFDPEKKKGVWGGLLGGEK